MRLPVLVKKHSSLHTVKQGIQMIERRFYIFLSALIFIVIAIIFTFALEFDRVTTTSYDTIAKDRINNTGIQTELFLNSHLDSAYQDISTFSSILEHDAFEDSSGAIDEAKLYTFLANNNDSPFFLNNVGVVYNGYVIFDENNKFQIPFDTIDKRMVYQGLDLGLQEDENLYFFLPQKESSNHPNLLGYVGKLSKQSFEATIHTKIYNDETTTLIVRANGDIITFASGKHKWRFDNFNGLKFTNLTTAMKIWVNEIDYNRYLEFMKQDEINIFNAGKYDRDGMFYKTKLEIGDINEDYYLIFMAPKNLLTNQTVSLTTTALTFFYISLTLGTISIVLLSFIIERQYIRRRMENAYDQKSGLLREDAFFHDAQAILLQSPQKEFGIIHLNIKNFKKINNDYGSDFGDRILDTVGKAIAEQYKSSTKDIAGHQHGDSFMLLLEGNMDELSYKATEVNHLLTNTLYENDLKLSFSFGIKCTSSQYSLDLHSEYDLAKVAEKNHKNKLFYDFYDEEMAKKKKEKDDLNGRFEEALLNEEFEVFLQLKWDLKKNDWAGAEALCRWRDPIKGLISPGKFIPLFEENGKIVKLDAYMFEQTCKIIAKMLDNAERCVPVSFNLSKRNFQDLSFIDSYQDIIEKYKIPHDLIEIEITEGLLIDNVETFTSCIKIFHENDFNISMDDFGAGFSSLNMIHQLDFDVIKIDAKFFRGGFDEANQTIVSSIINLCHKLNKIVVAEGIEQSNEVEFLRSAGCDIIQGYYFAKPLPLEDFKKLLFSKPDKQ